MSTRAVSHHPTILDGYNRSLGNSFDAQWQLAPMRSDDVPPAYTVWYGMVYLYSTTEHIRGKCESDERISSSFTQHTFLVEYCVV